MNRLFSSVFEGSAKGLSLGFRLVGTNLDVTGGAMTVSLVIFTGDDLTSNTLDHVFGT